MFVQVHLSHSMLLKDDNIFMLHILYHHTNLSKSDLAFALVVTFRAFAWSPVTGTQGRQISIAENIREDDIWSENKYCNYLHVNVASS